MSFSSIIRRRMVVELGPNLNPVATRKGQQVVGPEDNYVCIDMFESDDGSSLQELQRQLRLHHSLQKAAGHWFALKHDAADLPLQNDTVDQIIAVNFFGDPSTWRKHDRIASEIARVLKPIGLVTVAETTPPHFVGLEQIRELMRREGLIQLSLGSEADAQIISRFSNIAPGDDGAFLAEFGFPQQETDADVINISAARSYSGGQEGVVSCSIGEVVEQLAGVVGTLAIAQSMAETSARQITGIHSSIAGLAMYGPSTHLAGNQEGLDGAFGGLSAGAGALAEAAGQLRAYASRVGVELPQAA
ncbi:MAG TPA: hypothetical protein VMR45_02650 [Patescibacteria group bacterium]|nr:hypothetical protein [Patescibacteria group bacterium]